MSVTVLGTTNPQFFQFSPQAALLLLAMFRRGGESTAFVINNTIKVHTTFPDGSELVEEYDEATHRLQGKQKGCERL